MNSVYTVITWIKPDDRVGVKLFREEPAAYEFVDRLKEAYELLELDWNLKITNHGVRFED